MSNPSFSNVPLLGALCVTSGLVAQADLEECLRLQQTIYLGTPIGQIMVLKGYLTQLELARMVAQQQLFRRTFCVSLDQSLASTSDEAPAEVAVSALPELDTFTAAELDAHPFFEAAR